MGIQKLDKRGMQFKNAFFAITVASMAVIAVSVILDNMSSHYNSGIPNDLQGYNNLNSISGEAQNQQNRISPQDADPGSGTDFESKLFRGGYGILGRIFSPFQLVFNMISSIETRFGIPSYVGIGVITIMFFAIITSIIAVIFRLLRSSV